MESGVYGNYQLTTCFNRRCGTATSETFLDTFHTSRNLGVECGLGPYRGVVVVMVLVLLVGCKMIKLDLGMYR